MARDSKPCQLRQPCSTFEQILPLLNRKDREQTGLFWAEGCRSLFAAREQGWRIRAIVVCSRLLRSRHAWAELQRCDFPVIRTSRDEFALLSRRVEPDGIGVVCEQRWSRLIEQRPKGNDLWVCLDAIRTPGNLGTILRTCAAVGAQGVMLVGGEVDPYEPAVVRASMGALFKTQLIRTSGKALAAWKGHCGLPPVRFIGTSPSAPIDYLSVNYRGPLVLTMGSERSGLRERQIALCDELVRLPMTGIVDSLNLAVATSIVLYQARGAQTAMPRHHLERAAAWSDDP